MLNIKIDLRDAQGQVVERIEGSFSLEALNVLRNFSLLMSRVRRTRLLTAGLPSITKVALGENGRRRRDLAVRQGRLNEDGSREPTQIRREQRERAPLCKGIRERAARALRGEDGFVRNREGMRGRGESSYLRRSVLREYNGAPRPHERLGKSRIDVVRK